MNSKTATRTSDSSGASTAELRQQTETIKEDIRKLGNIARDVAQDKLDEARQAATEAVESGRQKASDMLEKSRDKAGDVEDQMVEYVRNKPIKTVLIAGGIGLLLGAFLSRR